MLFLKIVKQNLMKSISTLLLCSVIVMSSKAQWSIDTKVNNLITNESANNEKFFVKAVVDPNGNTYAIWSENRSTTADNKDIFVQKINRFGVRQWTTGDKVICNAPANQDRPQVVFNGTNRIFIIWEDRRNLKATTPVTVPDSSNNVDIYYQCIDLNGNTLYAANGILLDNNIRSQSDPRITLLSNNTEIGVAYTDFRNPVGTPINTTNIQDIYVNKINIATGAMSTVRNLNSNLNNIPSGSLDFNGNGRQSGPAIAADNSGGFYIAWLDQRISPTVDPQRIATEIYMQHVDNNLNTLWIDNGINISGNNKDGVLDYQLTEDGAGGVYVSWADQRVASFTAPNGSALRTNRNDVYLMRYDYGGTLNSGWTPTPGILDYDAGTTNAAGVRVTTDVATNESCVNDQDKATVTIGSDGNPIIVWVDERESSVALNSFAVTDLFCQKYNAATGASLWGSSGTVNGANCGVRVAALAGSNQPHALTNGTSRDAFNYAVLPDTVGGIYVTWSDNRAIGNGVPQQNEHDLYLRRILNSNPTSFSPCSDPADIDGILIADGINQDIAQRNQLKPVLIPLTYNNNFDGALVVFLDGKDNASVPPTSGGANTPSTLPTAIYAQITASNCRLGTLSTDFERVTASTNGTVAIVKWEVSNAQNTQQYIVERSKDGVNFETLGVINANSGSNYEAVDVNPYKGVNYYRIISVDNSNIRKTSTIVNVQFTNKTVVVRAMPNPVTNKLYIIWPENVIGKHQIGIYTNSGQLIQNKEVQVQAGSQSTTVNMNTLPSGVYMLSIANETGKRIFNKTIIKQ
jgi:hypothetical protein